MLGTMHPQLSAAPYTQSVRHVTVRKATPDDAHDIVRVACSVGNSTKDPDLGFLVSNYTQDPIRFLNEITEKTVDLDYFYVAESGRVCGFLMAYGGEEWLDRNPDWVCQTHWRPGFDISETSKFVLVEKTVVMAGMTGQGIGSQLYSRLVADIVPEGITSLFGETVISPTPNYASLEFRRKQSYELAGVRYEQMENLMYTCLVYRKNVGRFS